MQQGDQELLCRARAGEESAIAALIARMMPAIRRGAAECTAHPQRGRLRRGAGTGF